MPKRKVRNLEIIQIFGGANQPLIQCKRLWRHPSETLLNYNATYDRSPSLGIFACFLHIMYIFCVVEWIFSRSRTAFKARVECASRCPLGESEVSLGLHAVKAQAAAMLCSSLPPSSPDLPRTKRSAYRRGPTEPPASSARKCPGAPALRFDREIGHSPRRFGKIIYFLSLFVVPNGCSGAPLPPGGARERPPAGPPAPSWKAPAPAFKSELHALNEGAGGGERKRGLDPQNVAPRSRMARLLLPAPQSTHDGHILSPQCVKSTWIWISYFSFHVKLKSFSKGFETYRNACPNLAEAVCLQ